MRLVRGAIENSKRIVLGFTRSAPNFATLNFHRETGHAILWRAEAINHNGVQHTPIFHPKSAVRFVIQERRLGGILSRLVVAGFDRPDARVAAPFELRRDLRQDIGHGPTYLRSLRQF